MKALLALGADANAMAVTKEGVSLSCLQVAAANGKLDTVNILLGAGALVKCGKSCLLEPARQGRDDIIKVLLEAGADPNMPGANWDTPLLLAQKNGQKATVAFLQSFGAIVSHHHSSYNLQFNKDATNATVCKKSFH